MAKVTNSPTGFDLVVERVQNKFPHFLLGITVLIIGVIVISLVMRSRNAQQVSDLTQAQTVMSPTKADATATPAMKKSIGSKIAEFFLPKKNDAVKVPSEPNTYTVKAGDGLWNVAEATYKDGYKWKAIAEANKLTAPYNLEIGQKLVLPQDMKQASSVATLTPIVTYAAAGETTAQAAATDSKVTVSGPSYVVKEGECLWTIAANAYGDGFMYAKIAQANNIADPSLIYPGQRFVLPRN